MEPPAQELVLLLLCSLGLLLLPAGAQLITTQELYVNPTEDISCPEPCHTLDEYVHNASQYFLSNTTFNFLPGNHSLSLPLNVSGVANLDLVAINGTVNITCHGNFSIMFTEIFNLSLDSLTFYSCPAFDLSDLINLNILGCYMEAAPLQDSWQLIATNILGISRVIGLTVTLPDLLYTPPHLSVVYDDNYNLMPSTHNKLVVADCTFLPRDFTVQTVEIILDLSQTTYTANISLNRLIAIPNVNTDIIASIWSSTQNIIAISNSNLIHANLQINDFEEHSETSLTISDCHFDTSSFSFRATSMSFTIENSVFSRSPGLIYTSLVPPAASPVTLSNVTFADSEGFSTSIIDFYSDFEGTLVLWGITKALLIDCRFIANRPTSDQLEVKGSSLALLYFSYNVNLINCEFRDNMKRAIVADSSAFTLWGKNVFSNNTASMGGAMAFYGFGWLTFANGSTTHFINNSATMVGGAVYVVNEHAPQCFFQIQSQFCKNTNLPFSVSFDNNTATNGGDLVYGASLDACWVAINWTNLACIGSNYIEAIFSINKHQGEGSDFSAITSDPIRACLCVNGRPSCTTVFSNLTVYSGETFPIPAVVVGDRFGTVDGSVYAQLLPTNDTKTVAQLEDLQFSQQVTHNSCTELSYTILSNSSSITLVLTAISERMNEYPSAHLVEKVMNETNLYNSTGMIDVTLQSFPVYINITLLPCPLGFVLSGEPPRCNCDPHLLRHHIKCNLSTQTVKRSGTQWVNASFRHHKYHGVIVDNYCPNNYCEQGIVNVDLRYPDAQCAFDRSGILCGGCPSGLSLALGSAQCLSCSNTYLALLIPFALAGILLVLLIKILNLTVAEGTLNGLILYANVVKANSNAWIPVHDSNILTVFISWLNLDLGIETCFFNGLDAYWRTWLQFVFPLYIWAIAILIIVLSHYSESISRLNGKNGVPSLATLFLLTYTKFFQITVSILHACTHYRYGAKGVVWSHDGNVPYFSNKRLPMLFVGILVIPSLWVFYTGLLTFTRVLHRSSSYRLNRILVKLKPFLDAYRGPLKDKHRNYVGLMLLFRGVLFITYASTPTSRPEVGLLVTLILVLVLQMYLGYFGQPYKKKYLNLLENSFLVNLGILAAGTQYVRQSGGHQSAWTYTSIGVAFVQFNVIVAVHIAIRLRSLKLYLVRTFYRVLKPEMENIADQRDFEISSEPSTVEVSRNTNQVIVVTYSEFREPVLKYIDSQS